MKIYMYTFYYILEVALQPFERFSSQTDFFNLKRNTIHSILIHITVCRGSLHSVGMGTTHTTSFFYHALHTIIPIFMLRICFPPWPGFIPPILIGLFASVLPGLKPVGFFIIICLPFLAVCFVLARLRIGFASAAAASDPRNDPRRFPRRLASACTVSYVRIPKYRKKGRRRRQNRISVVVRTRDEKEGLGFIYLCLYYVVYNTQDCKETSIS